MKGESTVRFSWILALGLAGNVHAQDAPDTTKARDAKGGLWLAVDIQGTHTNEQWSSDQEWPFALQGKAEVPHAAFGRLVPASRTEKPVELEEASALFGCLAKGIADKENGEGVRRASGKLLGRIREQAGARTVVEFSGSIRLEWQIQGNTFWVEGRAIEGSVVFEGDKAVAFEVVSKKPRTGGTWDWGGGGVRMGGTVSAFRIRTAPAPGPAIENLREH